MLDIDDKLYSVRDILDVLARYESEDVWAFASDVSSISEDRLLEMIDEMDAEEEFLSKVKVAGYTHSPLCLGVYDDKSGETYTVCLDSEIAGGTLMPLFCAYLDVNNVPDVEEKLRNAGIIAEPYTSYGTPVVKSTGFVTYPLYRFNAEKLRKIDPEGTRAYEEAYWKKVEEIKQKRAEALRSNY